MKKRQDCFTVIKGEKKMAILINERVDRRRSIGSVTLDFVPSHECKENDELERLAAELFALGDEIREQNNFTCDDMNRVCKDLRKELSTC